MEKIFEIAKIEKFKCDNMYDFSNNVKLFLHYVQILIYGRYGQNYELYFSGTTLECFVSFLSKFIVTRT